MKREPVKQGEVVQCVGGFKVCVNEAQQAFSGPWRTREAARLAAEWKYDEAHQEEARSRTSSRSE